MTRTGKKGFSVFLAMMALIAFSSCRTLHSQIKAVSPQEVETISELIFQNECSGKDIKLLTWNDGENFPSFGIGHFIWYPENQKGPFDESFPRLLSFFEARGIELPAWFQTLPKRHAPWANKSDFVKALQQGKLDFLRTFLIETKKLQAEFLIDRFSQSIPKMLRAVSPESRPAIRKKLSEMLKANAGLYPLVDYVNSRGEGLLASEQYQGQGWGLLQVLEEMKPAEGDAAVQEFVRAAEMILDRRVANSPPERNEKRWLPGWKIRVHTYLTAQDPTGSIEDPLLREMLLTALNQNVPFTEKPGRPNVDDIVPAPSIAG